MRLSYSRWVAFVERHHRLIAGASALLAVACALSLGRVRLDIDVLNMLPHGSPAFDEFKSFIGDFGDLNQLIVLVDGAELPQMQRFADAMASRLEALDTVSRVQVRVDVDRLLTGLLGRHLYAYIPAEAYADLASRLTPEAIDAQVAVNRGILSAPFDLSAAQAVVQDPLGLRRLAAASLADSYSGTAPSMSSGYFASADSSALVLFVRPKASAFDAVFTEKLMRQVKSAAEDARLAGGDAASGIRVAYTGSYAYALEDQATLKWDIARYTLLALAGVLAVFYCGYRNLRILPFVTYPLLLTTLVTFALSLLFFQQLNAVSLCFAAILYGLSIDAAVYYYSRLLEERRAEPDLARAVTATLAGLGRPNIAASSTTAAAFAIIGTSALTAVSQIGVLTAVGMVVSTALFFGLYPALSFLLPGSFSRSSAPRETPRLERLARTSATHAVGVGAAFAIAGAVCLFLARGVGLDVALTHLRPSESEAVRVQDEIEARFGATQTSGAFVIRGPDLDQSLAESEEIAGRLRWYRQEGFVEAVNGVDGALPSARTQRVRLRLFNQLPRPAAVDALRQALARHRFALEKFGPFLDSFAAGRDEETDLIRYGDPDLAPLASLIDHHVQPFGGGYIVATYVEPARGVSMGDVARRLRQDLPDLGFGVASRALLEEELARVLRRELTWFCVFGVVGNLILLLLVFRHLGTAVAILTPVILVVVVLFAGMAVAGIALDPVNLIVTPLIFGIGVDYGVYVAARARECGDAALALRLFGRALFVTALTTVAGFGFLAFSRYPVLAGLGLLAGIGLFLSVVLAVALLPALLVLLAPESAPRP